VSIRATVAYLGRYATVKFRHWNETPTTIIPEKTDRKLKEIFDVNLAKKMHIPAHIVHFFGLQKTFLIKRETLFWTLFSCHSVFCIAWRFTT